MERKERRQGRKEERNIKNHTKNIRKQNIRNPRKISRKRSD